MLDWGNVPSWVAAVSGLGTLTIAGLAANYARGQLDLARTLREDKARPFVIVDFEPSPGPGAPFVDLVIRNIGETLARNVKLTFDPPLQSTFYARPQRGVAASIGDIRLISNGIPSMPPGREYRILFDNMAERYEQSAMERTYNVTVDLASNRGAEESLTQVLDLNVFYGYSNAENYGLNHIAKTLRAWAKSNNISKF
jgi:hypothetical protein